MHFHWKKMEDIINCGGGSVLIRVYRAAPDEGFDAAEVPIYKDGLFRPGGDAGAAGPRREHLDRSPPLPRF